MSNKTTIVCIKNYRVQNKNLFLLTNCIDIGANTLQTATFDAIFVIKTTNVISIKRMAILGKVFKFRRNSPIFTLRPVCLAASDKANPPPEN